MALSYLGFSENHQKTAYGAPMKQQGLFDEHDKLDDPHNKLNLMNKVKDKQTNQKVGLKTLDPRPNSSHNTMQIMSSKGKCLQDYTRPTKQPLVQPRNENYNPNTPFKNELRNEKSNKKKAEYAAVRASLNGGMDAVRTSGGQYGNFYQGESEKGASSPSRKLKTIDVAGKITREELGIMSKYQGVAGASKNITQGHNYSKVVQAAKTTQNAKPKPNYVKTTTIELVDDTANGIWKPNTEVAVYKRYSSRDRDQPESQLRKMQNSQIDLGHDMKPFDVNSKIVFSKQSIPEESFYVDSVTKLKKKVEPSLAMNPNSFIRHQGYKTNPENFRRSPMRVSRAKPILDLNKPLNEKKKIVHEHFDNDTTFVAYNSDMFRDHTNKVQKMGLRNDGPVDHPIVFQYNGGNFKRSYLDINNQSTMLDKSIGSRNLRSQGNSPVRKSKTGGKPKTSGKK